MAPIVESTEINRRPEEVFAYIDDLSRHGEWQELDGGDRSKLTLAFELKGHGLGVLLAPLAQANARKEIPKATGGSRRSSNANASSRQQAGPRHSTATSRRVHD
jgi:hypothetical protein